MNASKYKNTLFHVTMYFVTMSVIIVILELFFTFLLPQFPKYIKLQDNKVYPLYGLANRTHYTFDEVTGYSLIPNIKNTRQKITTDKNGFRTTGKPFNPELESIIFVGDSTVFGWGVPDYQTFPYLIAKNEFLKNYNVINMGVPSYSLGHIVNVLKYKVPKYKPKIVFVEILWPWKPFDAYISKENAWKNVDYKFYKKIIPYRRRFKPEQNKWTEITEYKPNLYYVVKNMLYKIKFRKEIRSELTRPGVYDFTISAEEEKKLAKTHILLLEESIQPLLESNVKVLFYIHPFQYTLFNSKYKHLGMVGRKMMLKELGAFYPGDYLIKEFQGDPFYWDGSHFLELGHQKYEKYFTKILKKYIR